MIDQVEVGAQVSPQLRVALEVSDTESTYAASLTAGA